MVSVPNKVCVKSKKSEKTCTVCVFMTETWIVNVILRLHTLITLSSQHNVYRKVWCITRDNVQHAPPKVEEKTWKKPQVH